MTNENTVTLFPCKDAATDGCPNDTSAPDTHCADCQLFHEEMAATKAFLADDSWKPVEDEKPLIGFETVEIPQIIDRKECDLVLTEEPAKPDLNAVCYTMNAAEVDAQAALFQIAEVLNKYQETLKQIDGVLASYTVSDDEVNAAIAGIFYEIAEAN
jgi:hypothetical protein